MEQRVVNDDDKRHIDHWLRPLLGQSQAARVKNAETLSAMLDVGDSATKVARELGVPRSTVESRVLKLRAMFESQLASRDARRQLRVALRLALPLWRAEVEARVPRPRGRS